MSTSTSRPAGGSDEAPGPLQVFLPKRLQHTLVGHSGAVAVVKFNSKGEYCVSGGYDKEMRLWNPFTGKCIAIYKGHGYQIDDLAITDDNAQIASCGGDKTPFLWDVQSGKVVRKFKGHDHKLNCVALQRPDGNILASGSLDRTVKLWDLRSRHFEAVQVLSEARDSVSSLAVDDVSLVSASVDGCMRTYDLRRGQLITDTIGGALTAVRLSADQRLALVSTLDAGGVLRLMDRGDGSLLQEYRGHRNEHYPLRPCLDHTAALVASGSEDGRLLLWRLEDGKLLAEWAAHERRLSCVDAHPSKPFIVTAGADRVVKLWSP